MAQYIFVTGGVASSLGKGMSAATIGALLKTRGYKVRIRKLDPYLNIDPSMMSPLQHGEVYVTEDGAETDLDLGHYERFLDQYAHSTDSISGGKIYYNVLTKERQGYYHGATVQMIPNVTDEIKRFIQSDLTDEDFVLCEVGGTVGDIESLVFLEAIRQFSNDIGRKNSMFIHLTLLPYIETAQELKTKPTQHSVKSLLEKGIQADMLICRSAKPISDGERHKLALFCNVETKNIIPGLDVDNVYKLPLLYHNEGVDERVLEHFNIDPAAHPSDMNRWNEIVRKISLATKEINIAFVVKYGETSDAYKSLKEAVVHAGLATSVKVKISWIDAEQLEGRTDDEIQSYFEGVGGVIVPGGFGVRGTEGKMRAIQYVREHNIPYLGICLGLQLAVIEFCRNVVGIKDANSTEFVESVKSCTPVVCLMTELRNSTKIERGGGFYKGSLRLGNYPCELRGGTLAASIYNEDCIYERHRHRYEIDICNEELLAQHGMIISGISPDGKLPEMMEIPKHPYFIGVQFHPEFKSRPFTAHPIFLSFVKKVAGN